MIARHLFRPLGLGAIAALAFAGAAIGLSAPAAAQPYGFGPRGHDRPHFSQRHHAPPPGQWRRYNPPGRHVRGPRCQMRPVWVRTPWGPERRLQRICR